MNYELTPSGVPKRGSALPHVAQAAIPVNEALDDHGTVPPAADIGLAQWKSENAHDGYMIGNGYLYSIGGLGRALDRRGKSILTDTVAPLSQLAWLCGPHYGNANLGYGWELTHTVDATQQAWTAEALMRPTASLPFWGVSLEGRELQATITDVVLPGQPVLLRRITVRRPSTAAPARVVLRLPVYADPRNGTYQSWNGHPAGDDLPSVPQDQMIQTRSAQGAIVTLGAERWLWNEVSSPYPCEFITRALATSATCARHGGTVSVSDQTISVDCGIMGGDETAVIGVWIVTALTEAQALAGLADWLEKDVNEVVKAAVSEQPPAIVEKTDAGDAFMLDTIRTCHDLVCAAQAHCGGVLAQGYMYPMNYVRDQYGSFRLFIEMGDYERAYRALAYHVEMQNTYGIQNAFNAIARDADPTGWPPKGVDGRYKVAEVPSYIVLMARDYHEATGDLARIAPLYRRLAYNIRCQQFSANNLLPSPGDESYTQFVSIGFHETKWVDPVAKGDGSSAQPAGIRGADFTDSNLLFIAAARYMVALAQMLGETADASEFAELADRTYAALVEHNWDAEGRFFALSKTDRRPALDPCLRWFWLNMGDPLGSIPRGNLNAVLSTLINPVRIVADKSKCAGMDPGYLLQAMATSQHPNVHDAAKMLLRHASRSGTFSEYYLNSDHRILHTGGTLRPWESGVCGAALVNYLLGLRLNLPAKSLVLKPHLPPDWSGWESKRISLVGEGEIKLTLQRHDGEVVFHLVREGGANALTATVEFGGYGSRLTVRSGDLQPVEGRPDMLRATLTIPPGTSVSRTLAFAAPALRAERKV